MFIPSEPEVQDVPFYDDVCSEGGWQGHTTTKTIPALMAEVSVAITRLGGTVTGFQKGRFVYGDLERDGYRIDYLIERADGTMFPCRLEIAALPVREDTGRQRTRDARKEKALKMALYMLRNALEGLWFLRQLSPGYEPLIPWMLDPATGQTMSQLWGGGDERLLPSPAENIMEGVLED